MNTHTHKTKSHPKDTPKDETVSPYEITKGVPIPNEVTGETRGRPPRYKFRDMEVGDAFPIPDAEQAAKVRQAANVRNRHHLEAGEPNRFKVGQDDKNKWWCWRVS